MQGGQPETEHRQVSKRYGLLSMTHAARQTVRTQSQHGGRAAGSIPSIEPIELDGLACSSTITQTCY